MVLHLATLGALCRTRKSSDRTLFIFVKPMEFPSCVLQRVRRLAPNVRMNFT